MQVTLIQETLNPISTISQIASICYDSTPSDPMKYVLPNACCTELYLSCNLRELIHIANERLCTRAQWEIRELVKQMVEQVNPVFRFMLVPKCKSGRIICNSPCEVKK